MLSVFISGLKKHSGKTFVSGGLVGTMQSLSYTAGYYKPIQTGATVLKGFTKCDDILKISDIDENIITANTYSLKSPHSPVSGAYESNVKKIELSAIFNDYKQLCSNCECAIVEGSNSISTPLNENSTEIDIVKNLNLGLVLVINPSKDTIDEVISGISFIYSNKVSLNGIILNEYNFESDDSEQKYFEQLITEYTGAKILGKFPHYDDYNNIAPDDLIEKTLKNVDIESIFGIKIAKLS